MIQNLDRQEGATAVFSALRSIDGLKKIRDQDLREIIEQAISCDMAYMKAAGIFEGKAYDEDDAFELICEILKKKFPSYSKLMPELTDDYMEAWEVYLDSVGLIEWN